MERRQTGPSPEPEERRRDLCEKAEGKQAAGAALRAGFLTAEAGRAGSVGAGGAEWQRLGAAVAAIR